MKLLPIFLLFVGISASAQITGTWKAIDHGETVLLILNADGTGQIDGEPIKYVVKESVITVTSLSDNEIIKYNYTLSGNTLKISGGDLDEPMTFTKSGAGKSGSPSTSNASNTSDKSILGQWSGNNESMEFKNDGTCLYAGHSFQYTANGGQIKLTTQQGTTVIPYTVRNNQLVINVNGQDFTYAKEVAGKQKSSTPAELVGKWCWVNVTNTNSGGSSSETCITLNADGTYTYYSERSISVNEASFTGGTNSQNSDRGTWWIENDRIFYNSQSQGQGSYRLEKRNHPKNVNDPMIVLDGQPFVTQTQKAPWR